VIHLTPEQLVFVLERHVATLTTLRPDGTPHVTPVAFAWDPETGRAWMTSDDGSAKVRNIEAATQGPGVQGPSVEEPSVDGSSTPGPTDGAARGAICQVDGGRWLTLEGVLTVSREPDDVTEAELRYARRYGGTLDPDPRRVALCLAADRVLGADYMTR
jgi:hypothetical protein